ncbi:MAG TPA: hypothetical protein VF844_00835 [Ktedonobacteraceae bacterium]
MYAEKLYTSNLPLPLNRLVGREQEIAAVRELLVTTRLLKLTGSGGCGKMRLALQIGVDASRTGAYEHGVWWVELAGLTDPVLVPQRIVSSHARGSDRG